MPALIFVSILWAFSFGLIKGELTGLDSNLVAHIRLLLSFMVFLPFALIAKQYKPNFYLMGLGAIQFGIMYVAYIASYQYLPGYLVAIFTIFTPLYILFINAIRCREFTLNLLIPVMLSIIGTAIMVYKTVDSTEFLTGFCILQVANIAFAYGQISYKHYCEKYQQSSHAINMVSMYFGAALLTGIIALPTMLNTNISITNRQWLVMFYLGVIASGIGFYLWNLGAKQVSAVSLAIMNNGYVPFALLFSLTLFGEQVNILRLLLGSTFIVMSLLLAHRLDRDRINK